METSAFPPGGLEHNKKGYPFLDILFLIVRALPDSNIRGLRSASVVAKRTSTGRSATSRAFFIWCGSLDFTRVSAFFVSVFSVDICLQQENG